MIICAKVLGNFDDVSPGTAPEILPATCSLRWSFPEEEKMMQYSRDKYFPQLRTKVINPVGEPSKIPLKRTCTHKSKHLHPTQIRGLSIPLAVTCKD
jgi:hypothetical protein